MEKVIVAEKFSLFNEHWSPKIAGELNGQLVKLVKFQGEFVWHHHDNEDELFYVIKGQFDMHYRSPEAPAEDRVITIHEGEFLIMPKGVEHKPAAKEEVQVMLFEPSSTLNTGNLVNEKTRVELKHI